MEIKRKRDHQRCDYCEEYGRIVFIDGYLTCSKCGVIASGKELDFDDTSSLFSSSCASKDRRRLYAGYNPAFPDISSSIRRKRMNASSKEQRSFKDYHYIEKICKSIGVGKERMIETFALFEEIKGEKIKKRSDGRIGIFMGCLSMVLSANGDKNVSDDDIAMASHIKSTTICTEKRDLQKLFSKNKEKYAKFMNERFTMADHIGHHLNIIKNHPFFAKMLVINGSIDKIVDRGYAVHEIEVIKTKKVEEVRKNTIMFLDKIDRSVVMQKHVRTTISAVLIYLGLEKSGVPIIRKILSSIFELSDNTISKCLGNVCEELGIHMKRENFTTTKEMADDLKDLVEGKPKKKKHVQKVGKRKKIPIIENI